MFKLFAVIGFVAAASAADLNVGVGGGRIIFEENVTANPAIWKQTQNLTVNSTKSDEVISRIVVVDNRPEKDGEAKIVEGGEGQKNVTIELQSPAVFRGFDFTVKIFADQENVNAQAPVNPSSFGQNTQNPQVPFNPSSIGQDTQNPQVPFNPSSIGQDTQNPQVPFNPSSIGHPDTQNPQVPFNPSSIGQDTQNPQVPMLKDINVNETPKKDNGDAIVLPTSTTTEAAKAKSDNQEKIDNPAFVGQEQTRENRDTKSQKTNEQKQVPTPVELTPDSAQSSKNFETNKTIQKLQDDEQKKITDSIFNPTQKTEDTKSNEGQVQPLMPQFSIENQHDLVWSDDAEARKLRQAEKDSVVLALPKESKGDEKQTTPQPVLSTTQKNVEGQETKNIGEHEIYDPRAVPLSGKKTSTTETAKSTTESSKLPKDSETQQHSQTDILKAPAMQHHVVPLPYVNH